MNPHYPLVSARAGHRCEYCRAPEGVFNFRFEVEHEVPLSQGGADHPFNCALSCRSCNIHKADHLEAIDPHTNTTVPLFNPRHHVWQDHFAVDSESATLQGLSPIGRATIVRLRMNAASQVQARRQWTRLGLFPAP